ncbi:hypothetical protein LNO75_03865 [Mycoplasma sp. T363T]|uniref:hypothetical protein n=1 Tax=Mycoplasma bradburyae TaxID=2963128 RepID=UPI00233F9D45|nr:hypothetical protein [Mycoplasma bradburyae]MDC4163695.1 hypothetical protein [Mycoplasma bradburyae]
MKRKNILKFVSLLGIGSFISLAAASCKTEKKIETTNPSKPSKPTNPETDNSKGMMDNTNPSVQPSNTEEKNKLSTSIATKNTNVALYSDYSVIKATLEKAYNDAQAIYDKDNASKEELVAAKNALDAAISKTKTDKDAFNSSNTELVNAYNTLKEKVNAKDTNLALVSDAKYTGIKTHLDSFYTQASEIISKTLQADPVPNSMQIQMLNTNINDAVTKLQEWISNVNEYSNFKVFEINNDSFSGEFEYSKTPTTTQSLVAYSSDFNNNVDSYKWSYAKRSIKGLSASEDTNKITNVAWIYSLKPKTDSMTSSYDVTFTYYGGEAAVLYLPYKAAKQDEISNLSLKYKLNSETDLKNIPIADAKVDEIKIAKIDLSGLKFGENKISFSTEMNKVSPMIGNIYITTPEASTDKVYDDIFGNIKDSSKPNEITVNFAKGYGLANKGIGVLNVGNSDESTIIKKLTGKLDSDSKDKDYYLIGYLGKYAPQSMNNVSDVRYYSFYVNAPTNGDYEISGVYNSGENRGLTFWRDSFNNTGDGKVAKFINLNSGSGNWTNKLKTFNHQNKQGTDKTFLNLSKGLNKIIVSGYSDDKEAPNLGNVTFTLKQESSEMVSPAATITSEESKNSK